MSGYIVRNPLMTDNAQFGPPQTTGQPVLINQLAPGGDWREALALQPRQDTIWDQNNPVGAERLRHDTLTPRTGWQDAGDAVLRTLQDPRELAKLGVGLNPAANIALSAPDVAQGGADMLRAALRGDVAGTRPGSLQMGLGLLGMMPLFGGMAREVKPAVAELARAARGLEDRISTRIPTAVRQTIDPHGSPDFTVGIDSSRASGNAYARNADFVNGGVDVNGRPFFHDVNTQGLEGDPEALTQALIAHARDNLIYLHDQIPPEIRQQSKRWYDGANRIAINLADEYGISPRQAAGVLASLSPQKDWFQNVDLAKRVLNIGHHQANVSATEEMQPWFQRFVASQKVPEDAAAIQAHVDGFANKPLAEITDPEARALWVRAYDEAHNPRSYQIVTPEGDFAGPALTGSGNPQRVAWGSFNEIAKAMQVLGDDSLPNISQAMGSNHKVRNFYNNIISPNANHGDVTIDTHAIAAAHMRPLAGLNLEVKTGLGLSPGSANRETGSKGLYGAYAEAYRQAAQQLGILPRELQSITWEGVRGLYSDVQKRSESFRNSIDDIWGRYARGEISAQDAREGSIRAAGGINPPEWWRPGS